MERLRAESIVIRSSAGNWNSPQEEIDKVYKELASIFNFDGIEIKEEWARPGDFRITWRPYDPNHPIHHVDIDSHGYKIFFNDFMLKAFKRKMGKGSEIKTATRNALAVYVKLSGGRSITSYCGQNSAMFSINLIAKMYTGIPADFLPLGCRGLSPGYSPDEYEYEYMMNGAFKAPALGVALDAYYGRSGGW